MLSRQKKIKIKIKIDLFFFTKPNDNFLLKVFIRHKVKETYKNILNSHCYYVTFLICSISYVVRCMKQLKFT